MFLYKHSQDKRHLWFPNTTIIITLLFYVLLTRSKVFYTINHKSNQCGLVPIFIVPIWVKRFYSNADLSQKYNKLSVDFYYCRKANSEFNPNYHLPFESQTSFQKKQSVQFQFSRDSDFEFIDTQMGSGNGTKDKAHKERSVINERNVKN